MVTFRFYESCLKFKNENRLGALREGGEGMENENRVLIPISEEELDMAYGEKRCGMCVNCKNVNIIGLGKRCCNYDCLFGLAGAFISSQK